ncbi:MAG: hypothetical protein Q4C96_11620 [Planctomycetia bacterium]|nr:hypothetical protein [Planctomycetia bacterium]
MNHRKTPTQKNTQNPESTEKTFPWNLFWSALGIVLLHFIIFYPYSPKTPTQINDIIFLILQGPVAVFAEYYHPVYTLFLATFYAWEVISFVSFFVFGQRKAFLCFIIPWALWAAFLIYAWERAGGGASPL